MTGGAVITGRDPATGAGIAVSVRDGIITGIAPDENAGAAFLSSGLIDLQVNGYGGIDLNDGELTAERVVELTGTMVRLGVTSYLPTLVTASREALLKALAAIAQATRADALTGRIVAGVHMEGPNISPVDGPRGAHPAAHVRPPSVVEFEQWQEACGGLIRLITLAPEHEGSSVYIRAVAAQGVHVALGHSAASPDQIAAAVEAGASLSTHLGNGVAAVMPRHPNLIWAQLAEDRLAASFIADGHHLPADTFKAMLRAKGLERALLVSDSVALAGMPPGLYSQAIGGEVEVCAGGRIGVAGTPYLAGAGLPLIANIPIAMRMAGLALADALRLATINPGRFIGGLGRLVPGAAADILRFSVRAPGEPLRVEAVWKAGEEVFRA
jgi:N-acetylglucosamine-6-phosphate deacetylase